ncbi:exodeoxyribonuclease III, partial [bacterium]|nr:exodeoxyribonuclease III [bacterium]
EFLEFLKEKKPDILCLQEIKIDDTTRNKENFDFPGYEELWNSAERKGYSGTMMLIKKSLNKKIISQKIFPNNEGRAQILELDKFFLINTYFPNANRELSRMHYKMEFNQRLLRHIKKLEKKKPVIITGDFNVAHQEIDLARSKPNIGNAGFTDEEKNSFQKYLDSGLVDTFRYLHPKKIQYTWWSYRSRARPRNIGWRIDYFCVSKKFIKNIKKSYILDKVMGSDHCPIVIKIK